MNELTGEWADFPIGGIPLGIVTKDSGNRQHFDTGARRDTQDGKPRWDLIPQNVLDVLQQSFGGSPMSVDSSQPPITGFCPEDETRYDLIPLLALNRLAGLYHRGSLKYDDNNWMVGMPLSRSYASLRRHTEAWAAGDTSEDHLSGIIWNSITIMWTEWAIMEGILPPELADFGPLAITK